MKRSEMIDEIGCVLVSNSPYPQAIDTAVIAKISEEILKTIEAKGMLPPTTLNFSRPGNMVGIHEGEWEPE